MNPIDTDNTIPTIQSVKRSRSSPDKVRRRITVLSYPCSSVVMIPSSAAHATPSKEWTISLVRCVVQDDASAPGSEHGSRRIRMENR